MRTLPRRWKSQSRWPRSARSTASSEPASSAATVLSRVSCLRAKPLTHRRADPLAVGAPAELRHQRRHHLAHLLLLAGAGLGDRGVDQLAQLLVGELLGQVGLDQLRLEALGGRLLGRGPPRRRRRPPRAASCARAAAPRPRRRRRAWRPSAASRRSSAAPPARSRSPRLHRRAHIGLHLLENAHRV